VATVTLTTLRQVSLKVATDAPPASFFAISAVFHYLGPAFAVLLFGLVEPLGVAWLRIASAAAIFAAWRRPWRSFGLLTRAGRRVLVLWGVVLAVMNATFYLAIDRLPLGTVAAIEFIPVVGLAAVGARSIRNGTALVLAVAGVYLLADVHLAGEPLGFLFAFLNAGLFTAYIVLGHRAAEQGAAVGIDGLAMAMLVALLVATPIGAWQAVPQVLDPTVLVAGIGVGVTSSIIPYVADQLAMSRVKRSTYALLVSLLPATATLVGIVVLAQIPTGPEVIGVGMVMGAVALHRDRDAS